MEGNRLKQRLVGATVLVVLAIILIPLLLTGGKEDDSSIVTIPPKLDTGFSSKITPLEPAPAPPKPAVINSTPLPVPAPSAGDVTSTATAPATPATDKAQPAVKSEPPKPDVSPQTDKPAADKSSIDKPVADKPPADKPKTDKPSAKPPASKPSSVATLPKDRMNVTAWVIQLGTFSSEQNALALRDQLRVKGYTAFVEKIKTGDKPLFRVRVGPELERARADALRDKLEKETKQKGIVERYPS